MGNTEERLVTIVLGHDARGDPNSPALDRTKGTGRVDAKDGHYADALAKGHGVYQTVTIAASYLAGRGRGLGHLAAACRHGFELGSGRGSNQALAPCTNEAQTLPPPETHCGSHFGSHFCSRRSLPAGVST